MPHGSVPHICGRRGQNQSKFDGEKYPDENYAREIMQLFSIGLYELDGERHPARCKRKRIRTRTSCPSRGPGRALKCGRTARI